jgi:DNA-binding MarR family transcriptional regulator
MPLQLVPAIHRATHRVGLYLTELDAQGLTQGEAHVLAHLARTKQAPVGELFKALAHKRSTLTSILDRLVERGLVTRRAGTDDRRTFVVTLTARGGRVARQVYRQLLGLEREVKRQFPPAAIDAAIDVLAAVEEAADRRSASAAGAATRT